MPMLAVRVAAWPRKSNGALRASRTWLATATASCWLRLIVNISANSSLPNRPTVSRRRTHSTRRLLNWRSSSSPSAAPRVSLMLLKRSSAMNSTTMRQLSLAQVPRLASVGKQAAVRRPSSHRNGRCLSAPAPAPLADVARNGDTTAAARARGARIADRHGRLRIPVPDQFHGDQAQVAPHQFALRHFRANGPGRTAARPAAGPAAMEKVPGASASNSLRA